MARRPSLSMGAPATPAKVPGKPSASPVRAERPAPVPSATAASRAGKVQLGAYLPLDAKRQLDVFAAIHRRTMQSIVEEMVEDFARKHGLHRLIGSDDP